jgi:hypothetical protein
VIPLPPSVEFDTLLHYLESCYGPAVEQVWTSAPDLDPLYIGWVFTAPDDSERELLAVPLITDPDQPGEYLSLFLELARQRKAFEEMKASGELDEASVYDLPQRRPDEPPKTSLSTDQ